MEYHSSGSLPLLGRPRYCPGASANGGYLCETGHCCGETGCCTYYYELWWFWMLWSALILFSCCCAYRHRRAKLRVQQQQRQRDISLLAYHGATAYPSSMLDLSFLASLKLPSYEEIAAQPSTPPPPYSSVFTSPRYPQPPPTPDPHLLAHQQHPLQSHCLHSDAMSSLSSDNSSSCSCDSCCPSSPCSSSLSAAVTYETDTSHASTPCGVPPLPLHVTVETVASGGDRGEVDAGAEDAGEAAESTAAADTVVTAAAVTVALPSPDADEALPGGATSPTTPRLDRGKAPVGASSNQNAEGDEAGSAEGPDHTPDPNPDPNLDPAPNPKPTPKLDLNSSPNLDRDLAPDLHPGAGPGDGSPSAAKDRTLRADVVCLVSSPTPEPAPEPGDPSGCMTLPEGALPGTGPGLDPSLCFPPASSAYGGLPAGTPSPLASPLSPPAPQASCLSPSPRATQSPPKQTLFSPCVDVFEAGPPSWALEPGGGEEEEEGGEEDDVGADESQYRCRRLTGDSGIEVCRCRVEEEEEEEEGGGGEESLRSRGGKRGSDVTDLHDSVDCPARALASAAGAGLNPALSPALPTSKDTGEVVIVVETA